MKLLLPLFLLIFVLSSATCKHKKAPTEGQNNTSEIKPSINLLESKWYLKSMTVGGRPTTIFPATLDIHGEIISGNGGCNAFRGTYKAEGDRIAISKLGATKKYCQEASQFESKYLKALQTSTQYLQNKDNLTLTFSEGTLIFSTQAPAKMGSAEDLLGSWLLISIVDGDTKTAIPSGVILKFDGKKIMGKGGCNTYSGDYRLIQDGIRISNISSTEMDCGKASEFESDYFDHLIAAKSFSMNRGRLEIETATRIMTFRKKNNRK